jgi:hypothetical protein
MNLTGIHHLTAIDFFARNGQQNLAQGFNPGLVIRSATLTLTNRNYETYNNESSFDWTDAVPAWSCRPLLSSRVR